MAGIKLAWDEASQRYDLATGDDGRLAEDVGLKTAVIAAVLTWARAREGDQLPGFADGPLGPDRKGHWADPYAPGGRKGSRVWLLNGRIITVRAVADAKGYLEEALKPYVVNGLVKDIQVSAWRSDVTRISARAVILYLDGSSETVEFERLV